MSKYTLNVNGQSRTVDVAADTLRPEGMVSVTTIGPVSASGPLFLTSRK